MSRHPRRHRRHNKRFDPFPWRFPFEQQAEVSPLHGLIFVGFIAFISCLVYFSYKSADAAISVTELPNAVTCKPLAEEPPAVQEAVAKAAVQQRARSTRSVPPVRFLMYNVHDYFVESDIKRAPGKRAPKPTEARDAVARVIASAKPDVIGLIEISGPAALEDLADRLAALGLHYPYRRALSRWTEDRALGILSVHPIVKDDSVLDCKLIGASERKMLRGILDVTVQPEGEKSPRSFRIIGGHLKSHVGNDPATTDTLRALEARTLAAHVEDVLRAEPGAAILVFGDWNDGPHERTLRFLTQKIPGVGGLKRLTPADDRGEVWTLYYPAGCVYNTFDHIYVSPALHESMRRRKYKQGIISQPGKNAPSDHRALWCDMY